MATLLKNKNMQSLWAGQFLGLAGTRMFQIAVSWWILSHGGPNSGLLLGTFMVLNFLPPLLLVKWIGKFIDRAQRKKLLITLDGIAGLICVALWSLLPTSDTTLEATVQVSQLSWVLVFLAGSLLAFTQAIYDPTVNRSVVELVPREQTEEAVGIMSSTGHLASLAGAAVGALAVDALGFKGAVLINALSYILSLAFIFQLKYKIEAPSEDSATVTSTQSSQETSAWNYLSTRPGLKRMILGFAATNFFLSPVLLVIPIFVKNTLNQSASFLAAMEVALWLGLITTTLTTRWIFPKAKILWIVAASQALFGLFLILMALFPHAHISLAMICCAGLAMGPLNVKVLTLFQNTVPDQMKGRFFALLNALIGAAYPAAFMVFGILGDHVNAPNLFIIEGAGLLMMALWYIHLSKEPL